MPSPPSDNDVVAAVVAARVVTLTSSPPRVPIDCRGCREKSERETRPPADSRAAFVDRDTRFGRGVAVDPGGCSRDEGNRKDRSGQMKSRTNPPS